MPKKEMPPAAWASSQEGQAENSESLDGFAPSIPRLVDSINTRTTRDKADAARAYAAAGFAILPLHSVVGGECSCGVTGCKDAGKHPRTRNGYRDATRDPRQVATWWRRWPDANIGVVPGSVGLLVLDFDEWKDTFGQEAAALQAELLSQAPTATDLSGSGSRRLWYRLQPGETYDNATGSLPQAVDVRSSAGYVVVAPSDHHSGGVYRWLEDGLDVAPLPDAIRKRLQSAQNAPGGPDVVFGQDAPAKPDLAALGLPVATVEAIHTVKQVGKRSEHDFAVVCDLLGAGCDADTILAIFTHYPIGAQGKYAEKGRHGRAYLSVTIRNAARQIQSSKGRGLSASDLQVLARWQDHIRSAAWLAAIPHRNAEEYQVLALAIVLRAWRTGSMTPHTSARKIAVETNMSKSAVGRMLRNMAALEALPIRVEGRQTLVDFTRQIELVTSGTPTHPQATDPPTPPDCDHCPTYDKIETHMRDDVFTRYPHHLALRRWPDGSRQARALGKVALTLWEAAERYGPMTIKEAAERVGLRPSAIRRGYKKLIDAGLFIAWKKGRAYAYEPHPNFEPRLDELREQVATGGIGLYRAMQNDLLAAEYAERQRERYARRGKVIVKDEHDHWAARRNRAANKARHKRDRLIGMGFAVTLPKLPSSAPSTPKPRILKIDPAAEWERRWLPLWTRWQELDPLPDSQRAYVLEAEGHSADDLHRLLNYWVPKMIRKPVDYFDPQPAYQPDMLAAD